MVASSARRIFPLFYRLNVAASSPRNSRSMEFVMPLREPESARATPREQNERLRHTQERSEPEDNPLLSFFDRNLHSLTYRRLLDETQPDAD